MAKGQSKKKNGLIDIAVIVFVIVSLSLLVAQLVTNVQDTVAQQDSRSQINAPTPTLEPWVTLEPTPTYDIGSVKIAED